MRYLPYLPFVLALSVPALRAQGEIEARLQSIDPAARTIRVLGQDIDVSTAAIHTLGGLPLTLAQCAGPSLPGSVNPGFVGGTVFVTCEFTVFGIVASDVVMTTPETVLIGEVTQNSPGAGPGGRAFRVLGVEVQPAVDSRLDPFEAIIGGLPVDVATIPLNSVVALEGYFGADGKFYAHVLEAEQGQPVGANNGVVVGIERMRCRAGQIDGRGTVSVASGTIQLLDQADNVVATTTVLADGTWRIRTVLPSCPVTVRARHQPSGRTSAPFTPTL